MYKSLERCKLNICNIAFNGVAISMSFLVFIFTKEGRYLLFILLGFNRQMKPEYAFFAFRYCHTFSQVSAVSVSFQVEKSLGNILCIT